MDFTVSCRKDNANRAKIQVFYLFFYEIVKRKNAGFIEDISKWACRNDRPHLLVIPYPDVVARDAEGFPRDVEPAVAS